VPEKFDAVVLIRIMRRGQNDAASPQRSGDVATPGVGNGPITRTSTPSEVIPATSAFSSM
jgi:hypothetical protein